MKVVIDTNIIVSAFFGGNPLKIIELAANKQFTLCISPSIVEEYVEVYQRFKRSNLYIEKFLFFCEQADSVEIADGKITLRLVEKDPDDDKFIECAVELDADYIITGDKALLAVKSYKRIEIVTPKTFLDIFSHKK